MRNFSTGGECGMMDCGWITSFDFWTSSVS